ncbi:sensor histidine kinase [Spirosoma areae]
MIKSVRYSNQDDVLQALIIPVYISLLNTILLGSTYWHNWRVFLFATGVTTLFALATWQVNNAAGLYLDRQFPRLRQILAKLLALFVWCLFSGSTAVTLIYGCYAWAGGRLMLLQTERLGWALLFQALVGVLVISIYEGVRTFERWERTLRETEALKKANLQSQFDSLRSQINPHFLFNSLNTLSSLLEEDGQQAEQFVEEMASVYRYLLRSNEEQIATLANELAFAHSYFHLLRTRYGTNIHLEQAVDARYTDHLMPPLTLQLLLENAVKHNVILPEQPLTICIETNADAQLVVRNNLQRKTTRVISNQVGLANIATQYRLLGGIDMGVKEDDQFFTVTLPLLRP